jgi:hypothetical protein
MLDSSFVASQDPESRHQEIKIGWMLFIPSFLLISVPFAFVFVYSLYTGRDESQLVMRFLNEYHVALFIPLIAVLATLAASIYLVIVKDVIRILKYRRELTIARRYDFDGAPLSDSNTTAAILVVGTLLVLSAMMFFRIGA